MGNNHTEHNQSALEKFHIAFEYDMSWQDAKRAVRKRADSK